ncbi:MAG: ribosomal RNA small subunit methyltransferase A [Treponema sp.]|nr:ribosomal RNA small subunit methyltransferase A [Treponema sp.]MBR4387545.1 ribosomal RNA small subunit methyltransferase A [Treponema sp.]
MNCPDYNSPAELKKILEEHGFSMQKKFGQNFMLNPNARTKIASLLELSPSDQVWEVGPGLGCMTAEFLNSGASVKAFEIDKGFIQLLHGIFQDEEKSGKLSIVEGDVLKNWEREYKNTQIPIKLAGNLPYNIAATFIAGTIQKSCPFERCVFTVQKEVADRICAKPSSEDYSSFSVLCQFAYDVKPSIELGPGNFWPKPRVASKAVVLEKKASPVECLSPELFVKLVHTLFLSRRKTIQNNIKPLLPKDISQADFFAKAGISPSERAENLTVAQFAALTDTLATAMKSGQN